MGITSKKYFEEDFKGKIWQGLIKEISGVKSEKELIKAINKALTPAELNLLEKRLAVLYLLKQKLSYRKIAEIADVHYNTISFIKKGLKKPMRIKRIYSSFSKKEKQKFSRIPARRRVGRWPFLNTF